MHTTKKIQIMKEIEELDTRDDDNELNENMRNNMLQLLAKLKHLNTKEQSILQQKSRAIWLLEGETNNKYYHSSIKRRRMDNKFKGVHINGEWCEEPSRVKLEVKQYFQNPFSVVVENEMNMNGIIFPVITEEDNNELCREFEEIEIIELRQSVNETLSPCEPMNIINL